MYQANGEMAPEVENMAAVVYYEHTDDLNNVFPIVLVDSLVVAFINLEISVSILLSFLFFFDLSAFVFSLVFSHSRSR